MKERSRYKDKYSKDAGYVLEGLSRERCIAEHLAWLANRDDMVCELSSEGSPLRAFLEGPKTRRVKFDDVTQTRTF